MNRKDTEQVLEASEALVESIQRLLMGRGPAVQGAALVQLTAKFIGGHNPAIREQIMREHFDAIRDLAALEARAIGQKLGVNWE